MTRRTLPAAFGAAALALSLSACSSGTDTVTLEDPWARPTAPGTETAAFYVKISNDTGSADQLIGAFSARCTRTELHQTTMEDDVMSMGPADSSQLSVPDGGELVLEPGGLHVMCMGVTEPFAEGEEIDLELEFDDAGVKRVTAPVEQR